MCKEASVGALTAPRGVGAQGARRSLAALAAGDMTLTPTWQPMLWPEWTEAQCLGWMCAPCMRREKGRRAAGSPPNFASPIPNSRPSRHHTRVTTEAGSDVGSHTPASWHRPRVLAACSGCKRLEGVQRRDTSLLARQRPWSRAERGGGGRRSDGAPAAAAGGGWPAARMAQWPAVPPRPNHTANGRHLGGPCAR